MAGVYIHIPFCKTKCHYCNFFSVASVKHKPEFIRILKEEIHLQKDYLDGQEIKTIYLGGGTPSVLKIAELNGIINTVKDNFLVSEDVEITVEANPDDIKKDWVKELARSAVNRISLGVQSFFDEDLKYLNRVHSADDAKNAIRQLKDHGMIEITIDLIYGIPGLDNTRWMQNLESFLEFDLPHLSAYALTVEDKTALSVLISKNRMEAPDEASTVKQFKTLQEFTEKHGFVHYEISNFAREGHYSKHNSLYWTGGHYLGIGPSAHSYNGYTRRWNKASFRDWLSLREYYSQSFEEEVLSTEQRYNEYVMTSLRTIWGCDTELVKIEFGDKYAEHIIASAKPYIDDQKIEIREGRMFLTIKGKLFADGIASGLFM